MPDDISVAVERDRPGLEQAVFVGILRHSATKSLRVLTRELRDLAEATPESCPQLRQFDWIVTRLPRWLALLLFKLPRSSARTWIKHRGGAALISSPAKYGTDVMAAAWPWPLGFSFGFVKERPVVEKGHVVARPTMTLTMSFDRRLMGGAPAARFFRTACDFLEQAETCLNCEPDSVALSDEYEGDIRAARRRPSSRLERRVPSSRLTNGGFHA